MPVRPAKPALPCDEPSEWRRVALVNAKRAIELLTNDAASTDGEELLLVSLQQLRIGCSMEAVRTPAAHQAAQAPQESHHRS